MLNRKSPIYRAFFVRCVLQFTLLNLRSPFLSKMLIPVRTGSTNKYLQNKVCYLKAVLLMFNCSFSKIVIVIKWLPERFYSIQKMRYFDFKFLSTLFHKDGHHFLESCNNRIFSSCSGDCFDKLSLNLPIHNFKDKD